jgi:hypothetical protein
MIGGFYGGYEKFGFREAGEGFGVLPCLVAVFCWE